MFFDSSRSVSDHLVHSVIFRIFFKSYHCRYHSFPTYFLTDLEAACDQVKNSHANALRAFKVIVVKFVKFKLSTNTFENLKLLNMGSYGQTFSKFYTYSYDSFQQNFAMPHKSVTVVCSAKQI